MKYGYKIIVQNNKIKHTAPSFLKTLQNINIRLSRVFSTGKRSEDSNCLNTKPFAKFMENYLQLGKDVFFDACVFC